MNVEIIGNDMKMFSRILSIYLFKKLKEIYRVVSINRFCLKLAVTDGELKAINAAVPCLL